MPHEWPGNVDLSCLYGSQSDWHNSTVVVPAVYKEWHYRGPPTYLQEQYPVTFISCTTSRARVLLRKPRLRVGCVPHIYCAALFTLACICRLRPRRLGLCHENDRGVCPACGSRIAPDRRRPPDCRGPITCRSADDEPRGRRAVSRGRRTGTIASRKCAAVVRSSRRARVSCCVWSNGRACAAVRGGAAAQHHLLHEYELSPLASGSNAMLIACTPRSPSGLWRMASACRVGVAASGCAAAAVTAELAMLLLVLPCRWTTKLTLQSGVTDLGHGDRARILARTTCSIQQAPRWHDVLTLRRAFEKRYRSLVTRRWRMGRRQWCLWMSPEQHC